MEIFFVEIGWKFVGDNVLDREGYVFVVGFVLGLVILGWGRDVWGLVDFYIEDCLRYYIFGGSDIIDEW